MNTSPRRDEAGCRGARPRLSLLAGGELVGDDRRKVEQHVVACPACQAELASCRSVLNLLRNPALFEDDGPTAKATVWPALQRRIAEAKHAPRPPVLAGLGPWLDAALLAARPRWVALAAGFGLGLAAAVALWADRHADQAQRAVVQASRPLPADRTPRWLPPPPPPGTRVADAPRFDYDLDHGTPMNPDAHESGTGAY